MKHYFQALERLISGKTNIVRSGTTITNDAVSLEAGFKKGSIKKSRGQFDALIVKIREAAEKQRRTPEALLDEKLGKANNSIEEYILLYEQALSRELSLVRENFELKTQLAKLTGENIIPLRRPKDFLSETFEKS